MPPIIELFVIVFAMLGSFFLVFLFMFLLALFLSPIERALSNLIWSTEPPTSGVPAKTSFKDFSKKH